MNGESRVDKQTEGTENHPPSLVGFHHILVPTRDLNAARDWYVEILGFMSVLEYELEDELMGISLEHPSGFTIGLHHAPRQADALAGFPLVAMDAGNQSVLESWQEWLDAQNVPHSGICAGPLGWHLRFTEPSGIVVELHTSEHPSADDA